MYRPSEDQEGPNSPLEPGTVETRCVASSMVCKAMSLNPHEFPNISDLPSGDQVGPRGFSESETIRSGMPPLAETVKSCHLVPLCCPVKAICLPSGDQVGSVTPMGLNVSCSRS